ncbi:hypothetical protein GCM10022393_19140 [Aquimarina addita]|uniref:Uncharacterized protein n=1 Tax=Aquimarina addita TaxID=870485 RepID=A0ABP6UKG0_9FLAO
MATVKNFDTIALSSDTIHNPYFSNMDMDYVYKATIEIYGNRISGIFVVKKLGEKQHRIVCTSQFGSTFFNIEFIDGGHIIHSIAPELNKKMILDILLQDLSLLIKEEDTPEEGYTNDHFYVLKNQVEKRSNFYFYRKSDTLLQKIMHTSKVKEKFEIQFEAISEAKVAEKVTITHQGIKLAILLNRLKN